MINRFQMLVSNSTAPLQLGSVAETKFQDPGASCMDVVNGVISGRGLLSSTFQLNLSHLLSLSPPTDPPYPTKRAYV